VSHDGPEVLDGQEERRAPRRKAGCIAVLVSLAILLGGGYAAFSFGLNALQERLAPPPDYSGAGTGSVTVEIEEGDAASDIAATLVRKDVVKSEEAFTDAAREEPASRGIQVGFYELRRQMSAESALEVLVDPGNLLQNTVTFPEGLTVDQIVKRLAQHTEFSRRAYNQVLERPGSIGLPSYARGNPEGYLFPATYQIRPDATPRSILTMMVDRYKQAAEEADLRAKAEALGFSPHDVVTIASLIQAEARFDKDFAKVSRVIYNRLEEPMPLQFDSTVKYVVGKDGSVGTSDADRDIDSPYNTYKNPGLPPAPIMSVGEKAIQAALNPAEGPWLYFVTTNPDTGETKFSVTFAEHQRNVAEFNQWCAQSQSC